MTADALRTAATSTEALAGPPPSMPYRSTPAVPGHAGTSGMTLRIFGTIRGRISIMPRSTASASAGHGTALFRNFSRAPA